VRETFVATLALRLKRNGPENATYLFLYLAPLEQLDSPAVLKLEQLDMPLLVPIGL